MVDVISADGGTNDDDDDDDDNLFSCMLALLDNGLKMMDSDLRFSRTAVVPVVTTTSSL